MNLDPVCDTSGQGLFQSTVDLGIELILPHFMLSHEGRQDLVDPETSYLAFAFLIIALVYAAVGQAGASGYIATMGLAGFTPLAMKTTALSLNLLVASIGTMMFLRAGRLSMRNVWPFTILGFPFSLVGGAVQLPEHIYFPIVGVVLILSGLQMGRAAMDLSQIVRRDAGRR